MSAFPDVAVNVPSLVFNVGHGLTRIVGLVDLTLVQLMSV